MAKVNVTLMNKNKPVLYLEGVFVPISNVHDIKIFKAERAAVEESNRKYLPIIITGFLQGLSVIEEKISRRAKLNGKVINSIFLVYRINTG